MVDVPGCSAGPDDVPDGPGGGPDGVPGGPVVVCWSLHQMCYSAWRSRPAVSETL